MVNCTGVSPLPVGGVGVGVGVWVGVGAGLGSTGVGVGAGVGVGVGVGGSTCVFAAVLVFVLDLRWYIKNPRVPTMRRKIAPRIVMAFLFIILFQIRKTCL